MFVQCELLQKRQNLDSSLSPYRNSDLPQELVQISPNITSNVKIVRNFEPILEEIFRFPALQLFSNGFQVVFLTYCTQWEIGWLKHQEVILSDFAFSLLIRKSIPQLNKTYNLSEVCLEENPNISMDLSKSAMSRSSILKSHFFKYQWILNLLIKFCLPIICWMYEIS